MQYWGPLGWRNNIPICQGGQCKCALQTTASCTAALHFTGLSCSNLTPRSSSFIPGTISWTVPRFYIILEKNSPLPEKTLQTVIPNTGCFFFTGPTPKSSIKVQNHVKSISTGPTQKVKIPRLVLP